MSSGARKHDGSSPLLRRALLLALGAALTLPMLGVGGCSEPLFPRREAMTQFDRYDEARRRSVEPWLEDEFGRRRPNLRGRLLQER